MLCWLLLTLLLLDLSWDLSWDWSWGWFAFLFRSNWFGLRLRLSWWGRFLLFCFTEESSTEPFHQILSSSLGLYGGLLGFLCCFFLRPPRLLLCPLPSLLNFPLLLGFPGLFSFPPFLLLGLLCLGVSLVLQIILSWVELVVVLVIPAPVLSLVPVILIVNRARNAFRRGAPVGQLLLLGVVVTLLQLVVVLVVPLTVLALVPVVVIVPRQGQLQRVSSLSNCLRSLGGDLWVDWSDVVVQNLLLSPGFFLFFCLSFLG